MCMLISVAVSGFDGDPRQAFHARRFHTAPAANADMRASLPWKAEIFDVTRGGCSCAFYDSPAGGETDAGERRSLNRYRRKGWSTAKIERAMEARSAAVRHQMAEGDCGKFCQAVEQIVHSGAGLWLVAHYFNEPFVQERVTVPGQVEIGLAEFLATGGAFPEDTVAKIVRGGSDC